MLTNKNTEMFDFECFATSTATKQFQMTDNYKPNVRVLILLKLDSIQYDIYSI